MPLQRTIDLRQSEEYAKYMERRGWEVESVKYQVLSSKYKANAFIRNIPLIGSVIKIQRPEVIPPEEELDKLAKKHHALFIKIEPFDSAPPRKALRAGDFEPEGLGNRRGSAPFDRAQGRQGRPPTINNFSPDNWPLLPSKTLRLDLAQTEEELWENLDPDAKYSIKRAQKQLLATNYQLSKLGSEGQRRLQQLYGLLKSTGGRKGFYTPKWEDLKAKAGCFGEKAWLVLGYSRQSSLLAGCLLLIHNGVAYYHHAANSEEGRKLLAGYLVLWEAIKLAKKLDCHAFDFEGIYDERFPKATRNWKGFTYFKKKFGGKEVEFPRPLIKYYSLPIKLLFKFFD